MYVFYSACYHTTSMVYFVFASNYSLSVNKVLLRDLDLAVPFLKCRLYSSIIELANLLVHVVVVHVAIQNNFLHT